jgi:hypothetical protein
MPPAACFSYGLQHAEGCVYPQMDNLTIYPQPGHSASELGFARQAVQRCSGDDRSEYRCGCGYGDRMRCCDRREIMSHRHRCHNHCEHYIPNHGRGDNYDHCHNHSDAQTMRCSHNVEEHYDHRRRRRRDTHTPSSENEEDGEVDIAAVRRVIAELKLETASANETTNFSKEENNKKGNKRLKKKIVKMIEEIVHDDGERSFLENTFGLYYFFPSSLIRLFMLLSYFP